MDKTESLGYWFAPYFASFDFEGPPTFAQKVLLLRQLDFPLPGLLPTGIFCTLAMALLASSNRVHHGEESRHLNFKGRRDNLAARDSVLQGRALARARTLHPVRARFLCHSNGPMTGLPRSPLKRVSSA
jgi:hypothetical protein